MSIMKMMLPNSGKSGIMRTYAVSFVGRGNRKQALLNELLHEAMEALSLTFPVSLAGGGNLSRPLSRHPERMPDRNPFLDMLSRIRCIL